MTNTILISEFGLEFDAHGRCVYHPLDVLYSTGSSGMQLNSGMLAFAGDDLNKSSMFYDVRSIWVEFSGEAELDREAWADPLRGEMLRRLSVGLRKNWCIDAKGDVGLAGIGSGIQNLDQVVEDQFVRLHKLLSVHITMPLPNSINSFDRRYAVEYPPVLVGEAVNLCWPNAYPGAPIEGYLLPSDGIELLVRWETMPRTPELFREVLDVSDVLFTTVPSEHRHFVFFTSKLEVNRFLDLIDIEQLRKEALAISA